VGVAALFAWYAWIVVSGGALAGRRVPSTSAHVEAA
jgi:hypothetical protein